MDERMFEFMQDTTKALGRIEEGIRNNSEHTLAVSRKSDSVRKDLQDHIGDSEAHGMGGERRAAGRALTIITAIVAVAGLLLSVYRWGRG